MPNAEDRHEGEVWGVSHPSKRDVNEGIMEERPCLEIQFHPKNDKGALKAKGHLPVVHDETGTGDAKSESRRRQSTPVGTPRRKKTHRTCIHFSQQLS